jgi:beta-lactamase class D
MLLERNNSFSLWAKTGWAVRANPQIGWFVGYIETAADVWFFATNINITNEKDLTLRQKLTMEALRAKSIID